MTQPDTCPICGDDIGDLNSHLTYNHDADDLDEAL